MPQTTISSPKTTPMQIREFLTSGHVAFTPSEERVVQILLNDYPGSGLTTAASLAKRAGVSDPTVNRLVVKLGFEGFPAFQASLLDEVEERLRSPLLMMGSNAPAASDSPMQAYVVSASAALLATRTTTPQSSFDRAVRMIMEARSVVLVGGRFSGFIAGILAGHLEQFRPGVTNLGLPKRADFDRLVDLGRRDVLICFDYRRYQRDVVDFISQAAAATVGVVLFTDRWQSPAAIHADVTLISPVEVQSPYDTMVPALAQTEALVAQIVALYGPRLRSRISRIEEVRRTNDVTESG
ncbi:transcriptional regulator, RpiR family [Mesorhizobium sp. YR577]|nr:transcriptional regulator, RpiR family [Mesorhizobium sp. YR577]